MAEIEFFQLVELPSWTSETYKEWSEHVWLMFVFLYKEEATLDSDFILTFCWRFSSVLIDLDNTQVMSQSKML